MRKIRSFFYLLFALTLLFYGLPRFKLTGIETMSEGFAIIWTLFAVVIIGAHLYDVLGANRERKSMTRERARQY